MTVLQPVPGLEERLQKDMQKQVEKAEKTARALVTTANKRQSAADAKDDKKRRKMQKKSGQAEDAMAAIQGEIHQAERDLQKAEEAERQTLEVESAIQKAVAAIKMPTFVPLTFMSGSSSGQDGTTTAARTKVLQNILDSKKKAMEAEQSMQSGVQATTAPVQDAATTMFGLQGVLASLRRNGAVTVKAKKVKEDRDHVQEVLKMGRHLLK